MPLEILGCLYSVFKDARETHFHLMIVQHIQDKHITEESTAELLK